MKCSHKDAQGGMPASGICSWEQSGGTKALEGRMDRPRAAIAHRLLASFRVLVLPDPPEQLCRENCSQVPLWDTWGAQKPPGDSRTNHFFPPTMSRRLWRGGQGVPGVQRQPGGFPMPSCGDTDHHGGEDEPCHHVPIPALLQGGELPPWVPLCLRGPSRGHRSWKGWKLRLSPVPLRRVWIWAAQG